MGVTTLGIGAPRASNDLLAVLLPTSFRASAGVTSLTDFATLVSLVPRAEPIFRGRVADPRCAADSPPLLLRRGDAGLAARADLSPIAWTAPQKQIRNAQVSDSELPVLSRALLTSLTPGLLCW